MTKTFLTYGKPDAERCTLYLVCGVREPGIPPAEHAPLVRDWLRESLDPELWEEMKRLIVAECVEPVLEEVSR